MAVVEVEFEELRRLVGDPDLTVDDAVEELFALGVELEGRDDGTLELEVVPDRPDRLSVEGLARSLRFQRGVERGIRVPEIEDAEYTVRVDDSVRDVRPYVTAAVVRGADLSGGALDSLIQVQEKLHATLGRRRRKGAIGVHDLALLKGTEITYRGIGPDEDSFVPLAIGHEGAPEGGDGDQDGDEAGPWAGDGDAPDDVGAAKEAAQREAGVVGDALEEMTPREVMERHPVGSDYAHILEDADRVPAIYDDVGLFSFPPVINGKRTEVTGNSRDLLIEMTGTDQWTIDRMLDILVYVFDDRGATVEAVEVAYPEGTQLKPDLATGEKTVEHDLIEDVLGVALDVDEVVDLAERSGLDAAVLDGDETAYRVTVPPYRTDVMHPIDVVDDVGRALGFGDLDPSYPDVATIGGLTEGTRLENAVRRQLVGLGFQDLENFVLTSPGDEYDAMRLDAPDRPATSDRPEAPLTPDSDDAVRIENPYSEEYTQMRSWLLPSLVAVLGHNTHRGYPQHLAEIGLAARQGDDGGTGTGVHEEDHVAAVLCGTGAGYEDAKAALASLADDFDASLATPAASHPAFVEGRVAAVELDGDRCGVIGELHPAVLAEREITQPVAAFEFPLGALR